MRKLEDAKDLNLEQNLLIESADREEKLAKRVTSIEIELNKSKQELERVNNENEKLILSHQELNGQYEQLKDLLMKKNNEIKTLKETETYLLDVNTELDGENVQLQQNIVKLKEDLVELDTVRHENKALEEKLETLESQIVELTTLKRIVEKQLEESLNSFREEREHKYQKKRESHERREKQSLQELQRFAQDLNDEYDYDDDDDEEGNFSNTTNEIRPITTNITNNKDSLLNEIESVNEIQNLEKKIEEINKHKENLETELNDFRTDLNYIINNIQVLNKKLPNGNNSTASDANEETKLNKLALNCFDKFKNDFELILPTISSNHGEELSKRLEELKLDSVNVNDRIVSILVYNCSGFY